MTLSSLRRMIVVGAILTLPIVAYAQEAALSGTVTDSTGGVLPGVTVRALHEASGNSFEAVTDERGGYRIPVRIGVFQITAELPGFTTVTRSGVALLVGQEAVVNLQMAPSALQETVTVTGEAPLVDTTSSRLGGNIDQRQLSELPVNGRNWVDLTMLAPGSRSNAVSNSPMPSSESGYTGFARGGYQLNVDGQAVTQVVAGIVSGQPRFSRDAIAEFELVSSRFDATQGRSMGVQVNAVTRSGTNSLSGTVSGYFRDDRFNAADFIQQRVLPYSNQQIGGTFGGPIRRDRIHYFGSYEYEREPQTAAYSSPFPRFNIDQSGTRTEKKFTARGDVQFSPGLRLMARGTIWRHNEAFRGGGGGATIHPTREVASIQTSDQLLGTLTQVITDRAVNEIRVGYAGFFWELVPNIRWAGSATGTGIGSPGISLRGYTIGAHTQAPQAFSQDPYSVRDDFLYSFTKGGRHSLKVGGEYIYNEVRSDFCSSCNGNIDARGGSIPANIEDLFPVWNDVTTWNLAALSPITTRVQQSFGERTTRSGRHVVSAWVQDDWAMTPRLTLNLGLRHELQMGALAEKVAFPPFLSGDRPYDIDNFGPRLGFAYSLNDRTAIRGGWGKYYAELTANAQFFTRVWKNIIIPSTPNDGRPDFTANPYNGPAPTHAQLVPRLCDTGNARGCIRRDITSFFPDSENRVPYSYQTSIGVQRQLGTSMSVEADYAYTAARHEVFPRNINLSYNPATGVNYPFSDISRRPYPDWGVLINDFTEGRSNYHALQTAFTKRFSQRWQASGTYAWAGFWEGKPSPAPFPVAPDLGGDYSLGATDQRHRAVFNGIWDLGYGFQLSGVYFFGSGARFSTSFGGDLRQTGGSGDQASGRLRPDGTIVPRNNFVGKPIHRVDMRVQRQFRLGRASVDGVLEVFNAFNHANFGSYVTQESARNYGAPSAERNVAYQPRMLQLGFRVAF